MAKQDVLIAVVGGTSGLHAIIREAALRAFPTANVVRFDTASDASNALKTSPKGALLLVDQPELPAVAEFMAWPVVRLGGADEHGDSIPAGEWNAPLLARVLRSSIREHALAKDLVRARGDLLTVGRRVVHDLRTPLGGILTSVEVLREIMTEKGVPALDLTDAVSESATDLGRILDRVSFLAKASATPAAITTFTMEDAVRNVLDRLKPKITEKGAALIVPDEWALVSGVPQWSEVIWQNLISNALQHGPAGLRIVIGWGFLDDECRFRIEDSGPGVSIERRPLLFQPFDELHQPKSSRGLGLSIVRRLVEMQGGVCQYEVDTSGRHAFVFSLKRA